MTTSQLTPGQDLDDIAALQRVPIGHRILDGGFVATKTESGAWHYGAGDSADSPRYDLWEPQMFPCMYIGPGAQDLG